MEFFILQNITEVNADSKAYLPVFRELSVASLDGVLNFIRKADRVRRAGEYGEHAVSPYLENFTVKFLATFLEQFDDFGDTFVGGLLIVLHQAGIANHIRKQDGFQFAPILAVATVSH